MRVQAFTDTRLSAFWAQINRSIFGLENFQITLYKILHFEPDIPRRPGPGIYPLVRLGVWKMNHQFFCSSIWKKYHLAGRVFRDQCDRLKMSWQRLYSVTSYIVNIYTRHQRETLKRPLGGGGGGGRFWDPLPYPTFLPPHIHVCRPEGGFPCCRGGKVVIPVFCTSDE